MKVVEIKVIYDAEEPLKIQKEIADIFYNFGATGLKLDEPLKTKNPLDFYKDEKQFLMVDYAVSAYFPLNPYSERRNKLIEESIVSHFNDREDLVYTINFYEYEEEDYQNSWKKYLFPEKVSERFVVKPTWREYNTEGDEIIIELDPGRAFGTGSHPTTSLCMRLMEKYIKGGESLFDVGTGSGILMIAADKLGAKEVLGNDIDELAVEVAKENLELNNVKDFDKIVFHGGITQSIGEREFDIVVANILYDVIMILMEEIIEHTKKGGKIIFSGIIDEKLDYIVSEIERKNLKIVEIVEEKEWRAIIVEK